MVLACGLVVVLWLMLPPVVEASFPGRNGLIAVAGESFTACRYDLAIEVIRPDGSGLRRVSGRKCDGRWAPDWSADGQRLLFVNRTIEWLGVMSADGSHVRRLTSELEDVDYIGQASFAPDGQRAVFEAGVSGEEEESDWASWAGVIEVVELDGGAVHQVRHGGSPRWSPDGREIAYITPGGAVGLFDAGTERSISLHRFSREVISIDWSPDGSRLLLIMEARHSGQHRTLATIDPSDPSSRPTSIALPRRLRAHWSPGQAVWSPDGRRIAFIAYRQYGPDDDFEPAYRAAVWIVRARGDHPKRLPVGGFFCDCDHPDALSWQPIVPRTP